MNTLEWYYFQYLLVTGTYLLEPWERYIFNTIVITFLLFFGYAVCNFVLPSLFA